MNSTRFFSSRALLRGLAVAAALVVSMAASAADDVNVRFSWKLKGEYAHLYLGQDLGLYAQNNLQVRMGEGAGSQAALGALLQDQEDVVIMPGIFAISAIQKGMPIKIIALYHAKAPIALLSHASAPVAKPKDLEGKTVAVSVGETGTAYLGTLCTINSVDCSKIRKIQMDAQSRVPQFLQNKVDVVSVYTNNDLPIIESRTKEKFVRLDLARFGLAIPGLAAVTSDADIKKRPDVLRRYLAAVNQAIIAAKKDPSAAVAALMKAWPGAPDAAIVEAQVRSTLDAIEAPAGKPIGWIDAKQIGDALNLLKADEGITAPRPVDVFFTNDLLPN